MAKCSHCKKEMTKSVSCTVKTVKYPDGETRPSIPQVNGKCHDCGCPEGGYHHPGCDTETCPRCNGQLISCSCLDNPEDDYEEDEED